MNINRPPEVITLTEEDINYFNENGKFPDQSQNVNVNGSIEPEVINITFKDIVFAEAHDPNRRTDKITLSPDMPERYDAGVVDSLKQDIEGLRKSGEKGSKIFKEVVGRYHPDLYSDQDEATQQRADEYLKVTFALRKLGTFGE